MRQADVVTVPARVEHALVLATTMRQKDIRELAACGQQPLDGLLHALSQGEGWALLYRDVVGAMLGRVPVPGRDAAEVWLLTGELFQQHPKAFIRALKALLADTLERFGEVGNVIDGRYTEALRLAAALGASFGSPVQIGGIPFVPFNIRRQ